MTESIVAACDRLLLLCDGKPQLRHELRLLKDASNRKHLKCNNVGIAEWQKVQKQGRDDRVKQLSIQPPTYMITYTAPLQGSFSILHVYRKIIPRFCAFGRSAIPTSCYILNVYLCKHCEGIKRIEETLAWEKEQ